MTFLFAVMATLSVNAYDFVSDGICYTITSKEQNTCEVASSGANLGNFYMGDVVIPEKVLYSGVEYIVTGIGSSAFQNSAMLTSVLLPETIEEIGWGAFYNCVKLKEISLPNRTSTLGSEVFSGCISLEKVDLGNIKEIPQFAFSNCSSLKEIKIPKSVTYVTGFKGCSSLTVVTFEDGDDPIDISGASYSAEFKDSPLDSVYIGRNFKDDNVCAFDNVKTLRSVYFSDNVTSIPMELFYGCEGLENVYGMNNVESIGKQVSSYNTIKGTFGNCTSLKKFVIGNKVKSLGSCLFSGCTSLETLVIGDGIEEISYLNIISGCNLKTLYLGKNIKSIGKEAFASKPSIQKIYLFSDVLTSVYYDTINGTSYTAIPLTVEAIYVANPQRYEILLGKNYNLRPLMTFNDASVEYTGKTPALSYRNNVEGMEVSFNNETTPKDVGNYNTNLDVTFANDDWSTTIEIPCSYSVTKAPLSIIADDVQRGYGEDNPELSCIYMGFKNGETEDVLDVLPTLYTTATKESNVGTYPIYASNAEAKNYDIRYERGNLIVNKASQTISWEQDLSNAKVGDMIELTATTSAGLPVKYSSSDTSVAYILTQSGKQYAYILKEGLVILTAYQSGDANHEEAEEENKILNITSTGIDGVYTDLNTSCTYYTIDGRQITEPSKSGVTIVKMNDGTIRKITSK